VIADFERIVHHPKTGRFRFPVVRYCTRQRTTGPFPDVRTPLGLDGLALLPCW
jgi:hypothetical protein